MVCAGFGCLFVSDILAFDKSRFRLSRELIIDTGNEQLPRNKTWFFTFVNNRKCYYKTYRQLSYIISRELHSLCTGMSTEQICMFSCSAVCIFVDFKIIKLILNFSFTCTSRWNEKTVNMVYCTEMSYFLNSIF